MPPISFLSLPREIRQKTLLDSIYDAANEDIALNIHFRLLEAVLNSTDNRSYCEAARDREILSTPHIHSWVTSLNSIDDIINEESPFVLDKILRGLRRQFKNALSSNKQWFKWKKATWDGLMAYPMKEWEDDRYEMQEILMKLVHSTAQGPTRRKRQPWGKW